MVPAIFSEIDSRRKLKLSAHHYLVSDRPGLSDFAPAALNVQSVTAPIRRNFGTSDVIGLYLTVNRQKR
jgi:hypothetical protein